MPMFRYLALMSAALLWFTPAAAGQGAASTSLGPDPVLGGGSYSTGGGITVAVEARNANGRLALCGAWAESERLTAYLAGKARDILASGSIAVDGRRVHHGLLFLNQVKPAENYAGAKAGCVATDLPWRPGTRPEIWIPHHRVVVDRGGRGGFEIRFGPPETANPATEAGSLLPPEWKRLGGKSQDRDARP